MKRLIVVFALAVVALADDPKPTVESLQAEIASLKEPLAQSERKYQVEMAICGGALNAVRQVAMAPTQQKPQAKK